MTGSGYKRKQRLIVELICDARDELEMDLLKGKSVYRESMVDWCERESPCLEAESYMFA
jgi:hypothetical protein